MKGGLSYPTLPVFLFQHFPSVHRSVHFSRHQREEPFIAAAAATRPEVRGQSVLARYRLFPPWCLCLWRCLMEKGCLRSPPQLHPPPQPNHEASQGQEVEEKGKKPGLSLSAQGQPSTPTSPLQGGGRVVKAACGLVGGRGGCFWHAQP